MEKQESQRICKNIRKRPAKEKENRGISIKSRLDRGIQSTVYDRRNGHKGSKTNGYMAHKVLESRQGSNNIRGRKRESAKIYRKQ